MFLLEILVFYWDFQVFGWSPLKFVVFFGFVLENYVWLDTIFL